MSNNAAGASLLVGFWCIKVVVRPARLTDMVLVFAGAQHPSEPGDAGSRGQRSAVLIARMGAHQQHRLPHAPPVPQSSPVCALDC